MAESMQGLHRSHRCTEVSNANIGEKVTVMGWVQKRRNLGSLIFVDLRDRSGILQIVFGEENVGAEGFEKAGTLRSEFVIAVEGTVQKRTAAVNENLKTGDIEVIATSIRVLSEAQTPPFLVELQEYLHTIPYIKNEDIRPIYIPEDKKAVVEVKKQTEGYKKKFHVALFFTIVLSAAIVTMFGITYVSGHSPYVVDYENELIDKYENWQKELEKREKAVEEREKALDERQDATEWTK